MAPLTIGLDIGTTSVKAVAADSDGQVVARTRVAHEVRSPRAELLEHDANAAWRDGPAAALAELGVADPAAVCVAAMVPSLTAVDDDGRAIAPGLLYGDARGRTETLGAHPAASGEGKAMLRWTAANAPGARGFWPAQAVANHALCGRAALDAATAGSIYPLYDGTGWAVSELHDAGAKPEQMPDVAGVGEVIGHIGDAVLASGLVDGIGEQVVSDAAEPGDVLVVLGTTLLVWAVIEEWREVAGLWTIPHTRPGRFMIGGASNAGGLFLDWVRRIVGDPSPPGDPAAVPIWEPYIRGERTPIHDPDRRAALHRLDLGHGPAALLRAAHEAGGFVVRRHLDLAGVRAERLVVSGGGGRSAGWVQAIADATGLPADVAEVPEGAALGAAWVARMAAGLEDDLADAARWARTSHRVEPDPAWAEHADARYAALESL